MKIGDKYYYFYGKNNREDTNSNELIIYVDISSEKKRISLEGIFVCENNLLDFWFRIKNPVFGREKMTDIEKIYKGEFISPEK